MAGKYCSLAEGWSQLDIAFNTCAKFSEKLLFLTYSWEHVGIANPLFMLPYIWGNNILVMLICILFMEVS